jgi:Tol biopolymer transport system component
MRFWVIGIWAAIFYVGPTAPLVRAQVQGNIKSGKQIIQPSTVTKVGLPTSSYRDALDELKVNDLKSGSVVVASTSLQNGGLQRVLITYSHNSSSKSGQTVRIFHVQSKQHVFGPSVSPDGRMVLFKVGYPWNEDGSFRIHLWNRANNKTDVIPQELSYRNVLWSPTSRYLALVRGADAEGHSYANGNQEILAYDTVSRKTEILARHKKLALGSWSDIESLLYVLYPSPTRLPTIKSETHKLPDSRPDIHEVSLRGQDKKIIVHGYNPAASPNGKWIAYLGWPQNEKPKDSENLTEGLTASPSLYLFDRQKSQSVPLEQGIRNCKLVWTPDNGKLIIIKTLQKNLVSEAAVEAYEISTLKRNLITTLKSKDFERQDWSLANHKFDLFEISNDGRHLMIMTTDITGIEEGMLAGIGKLQDINLNDGSVSILLTSKNDLGIDWHDESPPASSHATPAP